MSIDEAIAHAREVAEKQRKDNDNCKYKSQYGCKGCADYYSKPCIECAEEHEQLAEWLEELKFLRQWKSDVMDEFCKYDCNSVEEARRNGYNKAIDNFVAEIEKEYDNDYCPNVSDYLDYEISIRDLFKIAEQLKAGGENESK